MKLPSAAERTCLRTFDALKIATVASAIGLPPSSRTIPLIVPKFAELWIAAPADDDVVA
jgi:hypothetical protein